MGNYKFKLSNMMPNSWFYKLKDMNKSTKPHTTIKYHSLSKIHFEPPASKHSKQIYSPKRSSYYFPSSNSPSNPKLFDTHFPTAESPKKPNIMNSTNLSLDLKSLPPILTKPVKNGEADDDDEVLLRKDIMLKTEQKRLHKIKLRQSNSPKTKKATRSKKVKFESTIVIIKKSKDPRRDFRKSMVEMIVANDMKNYKELESLLACYLSLNSEEYHSLIVEVFKDIWINGI